MMEPVDGVVSAEVIDDHLLVITLDRVAKKNALTPAMLAALADQLTSLDDDPEFWAGVVTWAGPDTTAGLDMPLFFAPDAVAEAERRRRDQTTESVDPFGLRRRLTKPLITAVQGITFTAGIELALAGDIVVASADTRFCQLEPKRGLTALGGATIRYVQRAGWGNAMYHLLLADEFSAHEARRIGIVQEVVATGTQRQRAVELGRQLLDCAPLALVDTITNARLAVAAGEPAAIAAIPEMQRATLDRDDFREGLASFVERRPARFTGR